MATDLKVCYRCGVVLAKSFPYMGLDYCRMCREVIVIMMPAVRHDPPFGFPGQTGYLEPEPAFLEGVPLEIVDDEKKKEEPRG